MSRWPCPAHETRTKTRQESWRGNRLIPVGLNMADESAGACSTLQYTLSHLYDAEGEVVVKVVVKTTGA